MRSNAYFHRFLIVALAAVASVAAPPAVFAADDGHVFVFPDGRRMALTESKTELGVVLRDRSNPSKGESALRSKSFISSTTNRWVRPEGPVRIVQVANATKALAAEVRELAEVERVGRVFRFPTSDVPTIASGELLARVVGDLPADERDKLWADFGIAEALPLHRMPNTYRLIPAGDKDEIVLAAQLADDVRTVWSQPRLQLLSQPMQVVPQDEFFDLQWHLDNRADVPGFEDAVAGADINVLDAWSIATGDGILIGMHDDGCDVDHEDLAIGYIGTGLNPAISPGGTGETDPRPIFFGEDHGTRVMGLAAARANELGGRGVAFDSEFTVSRGVGSFLFPDEVARAYTFAMEQGVDVHINSWGYIGIPVPQVVADAIDTAFREGRNLGDLDGDGVDDPLGMVILFASGNSDRDLIPPFEGTENVDGFEISTLSSVISVGASTDQDRLASYSSYGESLDILAPSLDVDRAGLFTTDNTDATFGPGLQGANVGGENIEGFQIRPEADPTGSYTQYMSGTSGACPIAAGVAALMLSANPELTATDVRLILEHTAEQIDPVRADYDPATSHSLRYGYGRVNAAAAVAAASAAISNGGLTWPDRVADVSVEQVDREIHFTQSVGTSEFLILRSDDDINFVPEDGICYDSRQTGCGSAVIADLPAGTEVYEVGCSIACSGSGTCATGSEHCLSYGGDTGTQHFSIIARNGLGRYSWVVTAASNGEIKRSGGDVGTVAGSGGDSGDSSAVSVSISASPTQGESPLVVQFRGNAISESAIDDSRTEWDFDIQDTSEVDATSRTATHTYNLPAGESRVYLARLTMYDVNGNSGSRTVSIRVDGGIADDGSAGGDQELAIRVSVPGNATSDIRSGQAPLDVLLAIDASGLPGTLQSVSWDLGDGTRATTLSVPHTYLNETEAVITYPLNVSVIMSTETGPATFTAPTVFLRVSPGAATPEPQEPSLPGTTPIDGGVTPGCGAMGMLAGFAMLLPLCVVRYRRWFRSA